MSNRVKGDSRTPIRFRVSTSRRELKFSISDNPLAPAAGPRISVRGHFGKSCHRAHLGSVYKAGFSDPTVLPHHVLSYLQTTKQIMSEKTDPKSSNQEQQFHILPHPDVRHCSIPKTPINPNNPSMGLETQRTSPNWGGPQFQARTRSAQHPRPCHSGPGGPD